MQAWSCRTCRLINYTHDENPPERCVMHGGGEFEALSPIELVALKRQGRIGAYIGDPRGHRKRAKDDRGGT